MDICALFKPGLNFQDVTNNNVYKRMFIIEDDPDVRNKIEKSFKNTALKTFCAQDYQTALRLIYPRFENASKFQYAIIDDKFPEKRGEETKFLADKITEELIKEHPKIRIFGYFEEERNNESNKYISILRKGHISLDELYEIIITDAEKEKEIAL